jgi:hypothetical protein
MADATGQDATRRDATEGEIVVSVADAAAMLGISPGAVRKRLERGQLVGRKHAGQWSIVLNAAGPVADDATRRDTVAAPRSHATGHDTTATAVTPAALAQLDAIRDQWLQPLVDQLKAQAEQIGALKAERDALRWERDRLADQLPAERATRDGAVRAEAERAQLAERLRTDRALTDLLVEALQADRDAAIKASEALREENASLRATQRAEFGAATGQGAAESETPTRETSNGSAPQKAPQRVWWAFWRRG